MSPQRVVVGGGGPGRSHSTRSRTTMSEDDKKESRSLCFPKRNEGDETRRGAVSTISVVYDEVRQSVHGPDIPLPLLSPVPPVPERILLERRTDPSISHVSPLTLFVENNLSSTLQVTGYFVRLSFTRPSRVRSHPSQTVSTFTEDDLDVV